MKMSDYENCVINVIESNKVNKKVSYCGTNIGQLDFYFIDINHAVNSILVDSRTQPCIKCRKALIEILKPL